MKRHIFQKGDEIIKEGTVGTSAYVIRSGRVKVVRHLKEKEYLLNVLQEGQIFGEQGLIQDKPRSASIVALERCEVDEITRKDFNEAFRSDPAVIMPIMKVLFERIRQMNELIIKHNIQQDEIDGTAVSKSTPSVTLIGESEAAKQALNNREIQIQVFPYKIGRYSHQVKDDVLTDNDLYIDDSPPFIISRNHCSINFKAQQYYVVDRGSHFGTVVNQLPIGIHGKRFKAVLNPGRNLMVLGNKNSKYRFHIIV